MSAQGKQPQPVLSRAAVVTALALLSSLLVHFGAASAGGWVNAHSGWLAGLILAVAPLVAAWLSHKKVTPVESPKDNAGNPLTVAGTTVDADAAAQAALAAAQAIFPTAP